MNDLERSHERIAVVEREKEVLKAQLEAATTSKPGEDQ